MTEELLAVVRNSHDRLTALLTPLNGEQLRQMSYDDEWTIAQVASHLGSQSEIFELYLDAGLNGTAPPEFSVFKEIWARWDGSTPESQVEQSIAVNESFVSRVEGLDDAAGAAFSLEMFGRPVDLAGMLALRLGEHALHTWDVEVALDPTAVIPVAAVEHLIDSIGARAGQAGKAVAGLGDIVIETSDPARRFLLTTSPEVSLAPTDVDGGDDVLRLTGDELIRLVAGRLDPVDGEDERLAALRTVFPGF